MSTQPHDVERRSARRPIRQAAVLVFEWRDESQTNPADTLDVSAHGVRVKSSLLLSPGQVLEFKGEGDTSSVRCRVVWAGDMASDREGEAGLEFLLPPMA